VDWPRAPRPGCRIWGASVLVMGRRAIWTRKGKWEGAALPSHFSSLPRQRPVGGVIAATRGAKLFPNWSRNKRGRLRSALARAGSTEAARGAVTNRLRRRQEAFMLPREQRSRSAPSSLQTRVSARTAGDPQLSVSRRCSLTSEGPRLRRSWDALEEEARAWVYGSLPLMPSSAKGDSRSPPDRRARPSLRVSLGDHSHCGSNAFVASDIYPFEHGGFPKTDRRVVGLCGG
jgi:hypothetical protein